MFTRVFWKRTVELAVRQAAITALVVLSGEALNVLKVDWVTLGGLVGGGVLLCVLTSLASAGSCDPDSPTFSGKKNVT